VVLYFIQANVIIKIKLDQCFPPFTQNHHIFLGTFSFLFRRLPPPALNRVTLLRPNGEPAARLPQVKPIRRDLRFLRQVLVARVLGRARAPRLRINPERGRLAIRLLLARWPDEEEHREICCWVIVAEYRPDEREQIRACSCCCWRAWK
jgi:hypothetical protein